MADQQPGMQVPQIRQPSYFVGLGASAGGLEALQDFFQSMPSNTGMAFVVIQHLSPDYKSMMDELLARHTKMHIYVAKDGMQVEADSIYLIPPRSNLMIFHGKLYLDPQKKQRPLNLPIDIFFRSLAADQGRRCIAVVLSGTGSDGTLGVRAVKETGGIIMVQDERTAKFDGMPRSCISTGLVDYILPPAEMAKEILNYIKHPFTQDSKGLEKSLPKDLDTLAKINLMLRDHVGIDFSYYKKNTILRRLERRVSINGFSSLEDYLEYLGESDKEKDTLYRELLIGVTRFFRDKEAFDSLKTKVLDELDWKKQTVRIWSAGCSTGEEVYSLAMLCLEEMDQRQATCDLKIFATDIDADALAVASQGYYPESIVADIEPGLLTKYFHRLENGYQAKEILRKVVIFATHNLLKDPPFSRLDLMVCRNLFIYLKPEMQQKILNMFYYSLRPGGFLFMGSSETLGQMSEGFRSIDSKWKIYQYSEGFRPPVVRDLEMRERTVPQQDITRPQGSAPVEGVRQSRLVEEVLQAALPPSVIVDGKDRIVQVINDINPFFRVQPGQFSDSLMKNLPQELSLYANGLLRRLRQGKVTVTIEDIRDLKSFEGSTITMQGRTLTVDDKLYFLISFHLEPLVTSPEHRATGSADLNEEMDQRVKELERELQVSRENLQATVEELETSNEELQSSNEELIASNEELQSTNEELESVNEELHTVNTEYQSKIDQLTQANNDLSNLLNNTEVGAIYLDQNLCIRRITPVVSRLTHLRDSDLGRPISHIATIDVYPQLINDVNDVLETLQTMEREVVDQQQRTWFARIRPYRTSYYAVEGVLITFVDISRTKQLEAEVVHTMKLLETVLENSPLAKVMVDASGQIIYANKTAESLFGISRDQVTDRTYDAAAWKSTDLEGNPIPAEELPFGIMRQTHQPVKGYRHYVEIPGFGKRLLEMSGVPVLRTDGAFEGAVFALIDVDVD